MRIRGWHVETFGCFSNYKVEDLPDGLSVILGPNEAGKSTLHAFIRGVLFGFPARKNANQERRLIRDGATIGQLKLESDGTQYSVERRNVSKQPVIVRGEDGSEGNEVLLRQLLNNADAMVFRSIFAFGLRQLQDFESLNEEQVRDKLFAAAMGTSQRSPTKAAEIMDRAASELYKERGATSAQSLIRKLIQEAHDLGHLLSAARGEAKSYPQLDLEEAIVLKELDALRVAERRLISERNVSRTLVDLLPRNNEVACCRIALSQLPEITTFPADAERQLAEVTTVCRVAASNLKVAEDEYASFSKETGGMVVNEQLVQAGITLDPVLQDLPLQRDRARRILNAKNEFTMMRQTLAAQIERLGAGWTEQRVAAWSRSALNRTTAQEWQVRLEVASSAYTASVHDLKSARDALAERERESASCRAALPLQEPNTRTEIGTREAALLRLRALREAERERLAELRDCDALLKDAEQPRGRDAVPHSRILLLIAGVAIMAAAVCAVSSLIVPTLISLAVAIVLLATAVIKRPSGSTGVDPAIVTARARRESTATCLESVRAEVASAASALGVSTVASSDEIARLDSFLASERERRTEYEQRLKQVQFAEDLVERGNERHQHAEVDLEEAERHRQSSLDEWALVASRMGLPTVTPMAAASLIEVADGAKELLDRLRDNCAKWDADQALAATWTERAYAALATVQDPGVHPDDDRLLEMLSGIATSLAEHREVARRRDEAESHRAKSEARFALAKRREEEARGSLAELLKEGECTTLAEFVDRLSVVTRRAVLTGELDSQEQSLKAALGTLPDPERAMEELSQGSATDWSARDADITEELERTAARRDDCAKRLSQLAERKSLLKSDDQIAALDLQRYSTLAQLEKVAREWLALRLAADLVRRTKQEYENKRQPGVIANATPLFKIVTKGRYTNILQREDDAGLDLVAADGKRWKETDLSQGTQQQLFLCLRLALAQEFAEGKTSLPLIMDDVLVNFDPERASAVAEVLREVAKTRQVLVFTCHPWVRDVLIPERDSSRVIMLGEKPSPGESVMNEALHAEVA